MLPPVYAATSSNFVSASGAEGRDARPDGAAPGPALAASLQASKAGAQPDAVQALQRLAELLGSKNIDTNDILTTLAMDFARLLGESRQPEETAQAFANRLADIILKMAPATLEMAENTSGFSQMGITSAAFAAALKDPSSASAARIVALIEIPFFDAAEHALKSAISSYEQNSAAQPASVAAQRTVGKEGNSKTLAAPPAAGVETSAAGKPIEAAGRPKDEGQAALPASSAPDAQRSAASSAAQTTGAKAQDAGNAQQSAATAQRPQAEDNRSQSPAGAESEDGKASFGAPQGKHTMQVLRGFEVAFNAKAAVATEALPSAPVPSESAKATSAAKTAAQEPAATPAEWIGSMTSEEVAQRAQRAAKAMEGKVVPLFANASRNSETTDAAARQQAVQQGVSQQHVASRAPVDPEADLPRLLARLPEIIPFAQIPFPPAKTERKSETRYGYPNREREDRPDGQAGDDEQSMQQHEQGSQGDDIEREEKPFEAEAPLPRNASDAERAFHMYQRFGGF